MLSIQAVFGLPRVRKPGTVLWITSFSKQSPDFLGPVHLSFWPSTIPEESVSNTSSRMRLFWLLRRCSALYTYSGLCHSKEKVESNTLKFQRRILCSASLERTKSEMKKSQRRYYSRNWNLSSRKENWDNLGTSCGWTMSDCRSKSCIGRWIPQSLGRVDQERIGFIKVKVKVRV